MKQNLSAILPQIDLEKVMDGLPHAIAMLDTELRIISLNRFLEALTGYTTAQARGIFANYILRSNLKHHGNPLATVVKTGESLSMEGDIINQARKRVPIRFTMSPLKGYAGETLGALVTLEDMSLLQQMDKKMQGLSGIEGVIGHSPKMQEVFELLPVLAQTDASALITGETGTGKDLIAAAIHQSSKRSRYPYIKVNCGALPEALLESELFGHMRGAFTGADRDKPGMFRLAHDGTIYLTEIGDLPLPLQVKLLTVLDDKEFFPLGSTKKVKVDVRVIAATHRDLRELVKQGRFREDLFYRLNVLRLHLPPLREREGDVRLLLDHFLQVFSASIKKTIKGFADQTFDLLLAYPYPGNVRELRNLMEYAVTVCQGGEILPEHLPKYLLTQEGSTVAPRSASEERSAPSAATALSPAKGLPVLSETSGWGEMEKGMIVDALLKSGGRRSQAAKLLGWGRSTLWRKMKQHKLA